MSYYSRYWRINMTSTNGGGELTLSQVELMTTQAGGDLCTGGTASTSSNHGPGYDVSYIFDESLSSIWYSMNGVTSAWVQYTFPSEVRVLYYTVVGTGYSDTANINRCPKDWTLECSLDGGTTWIVVSTVTNQTGWTANQKRTFTIPKHWLNKKNSNNYNTLLPLQTNGNKAIRSHNL